MKKTHYPYTFLFVWALYGLSGCNFNDLEVVPNDSNFPFQLVLETDEGGDLPDAEDYGLEITFADYVGRLPNVPITITYELTGSDDFAGEVDIDKVVYEVEVDDCTFERELIVNKNLRTITLAPDADLGTIPETIEVVFELPGNDNTEGGFEFSIVSLQAGTANVTISQPNRFEYEVFDAEVAGDWELAFDNENEFEEFKSVFGTISAGLAKIRFAETGGAVALSFEFAEAQFEIELNEEAEFCEEGEVETENQTIEIEAEYGAEDNELELEGSHEIIGRDGEIENELDFMVEAEYAVSEDGETLTVTVIRIIDEENFSAGEELFKGRKVFVFKKD